MYPLDLIPDDLCVSDSIYISRYIKKALSRGDSVWIQFFWNVRKILQMAE